MSSGRFCHSKPRVWADNLNTHGMDEVSGLIASTSRGHFYLVNDSPGGEPYIFAIDRSQPSKRVTIEITGIKMSGFNPTNGEGYGDWEALAVGTYPNDPSRKCIIVGDIGHNKARGSGGSWRGKDQQTRLIYVDEPSASELANFSHIKSRGVEFYFQFGENDKKFDAEALAVVGSSIYVISKNQRTGNKKSFVYGISNDALRPEKMNTLKPVGEMRIDASEVTDGFATSKILALRTYHSINFYRLQDLRPGYSTPLIGYQLLSEISKQGQQEAMAYDSHQRVIYLCGEGSRKIFSLKFDADQALANWYVSKSRRRRRQRCPLGLDKLFAKLRS